MPKKTKITEVAPVKVAKKKVAKKEIKKAVVKPAKMVKAAKPAGVAKPVRTSKRSSLEQMKHDFLDQLVLIAAVAAVAFSITIIIGLSISNRSVVSTTMVTDPGYLKTQMSDQDVVPEYQATDTAVTEEDESGDSYGSQAPSTTPTSTVRTTPSAGPAENIILTAAALLGIIGSATFIVIKRGA